MCAAPAGLQAVQYLAGSGQSAGLGQVAPLVKPQQRLGLAVESQDGNGIGRLHVSQRGARFV